MAQHSRSSDGVDKLCRNTSVRVRCSNHYISNNSISNSIRNDDIRERQRCREMASQCQKRGNSSVNVSSDNYYSLLFSRFLVWRNAWSRSSNENKIKYPYAVLSSFAFPSFLPPFEVFDGQTHFKETDGIFDVFKLYGKIFKKIYDFFYNFDQNVNHIIENVIKWVFEFVSKIILTPEWLIGNEWFLNINHIFVIISILTTGIIVLIKILINIYKNRELDEKKIVKRFAIALGVSCTFPAIFQYTIKTINNITNGIIHFTSELIGDNIHFAFSDIALGKSFEFNELVIMLFLPIYVGLCIPIGFRAGLRWFQILRLGAVTPLAMSMWVFDDLKHYHTKWWNGLKEKILHQLIHSLYVLFIGLIIFCTPTPTTFGALIAKLLTVAGGLWELVFPPRFIASHLDNGEDVIDRYDKMKRGYKNRRKMVEEYTKNTEQNNKWIKGLMIARKFILKK